MTESTEHPRRDPDSLPAEFDAGLAYVFGGDSEHDSPSVLGRVAARIGSDVRVALRDPGSTNDTPMLRPLAGDDPRLSGKYVIQGELGRGGVGAVHRGHDQELGRDVALKFLQEKYKDDTEILQRFVEEAQIGGQLQHPGIVPVYDLGMVKGRPFFAMKLVKGETLAKRLSERASVLSERHGLLSIFEDICQTMAYAHARGVVHRDLKPANVMIGAFGEVQVVDWGVGKVLRQGGVDDERPVALDAVGESTPASVVETVRSKDAGSNSLAGSVMGTPAYMPPEQARGKVEAMDERSDVFALGAILCEILTGQPPYVGERAELIALAATAELDDAYTRLNACGAEPELVELAKSCLRAIPVARLRNAEAVASAVHDHLAQVETRLHDARVEAAEARVRTVALKRTQTLGLGLTAAITTGLIVSLWLWREADAAALGEAQAREAAVLSAQEAEQNEQRAERELARAVEIKRLITDMLQSVTPEEAQLSDTTLMKSILDRAATRLEQGAIEDELAGAELHHIVGDTYRTLALYDQARRHLPLALEARTRLLGANDDATLQSRSAVAHLHYALGEFQSAEAGFIEVLERHECARGRSCQVPLTALQLLASTVQGFGRFDEAEELYREAHEILEDELGSEAIETQLSMRGLGVLYLQAGRSAEAEQILRDTLEFGESVLGEQHPHVIRTKRSLASLLAQAGRNDEAFELYTLCIAQGERVWGAEHADQLVAKQELAVVQLQRGAHVEAESLLVESLADHRRLLGDDHPMTLMLVANLAALHLATGRLDQAEAGFREVLVVQSRNYGDEHTGTLRTKSNLAAIHMQRGELDEAQSLCDETLRAQTRILGAGNPDTLFSRVIAASILALQDRYPEAQVILLDVLETQRQVLGAEHPDTLVTMESLATNYQRMGQLVRAEELFVAAVDGWTRSAGAEHPQTLFVVVNLALLKMGRGDEAAEATLLAGIAELEHVLGSDHPHTLIAIGNLALAYSNADRHDDVITTLEPHAARLQRMFGASDVRATGPLAALATAKAAREESSDSTQQPLGSD